MNAEKPVLPLEKICREIIAELNAEMDRVLDKHKAKFAGLKLELTKHSDAEPSGIDAIVRLVERFPASTQYFRRKYEIPSMAMHAKIGDLIEFVYILGVDELPEGRSKYNETFLLRGDGRIMVFTTGNRMTPGYFGIGDYFSDTAIAKVKEFDPSFSEADGTPKQRGNNVRYGEIDAKNYAAIKGMFLDYARKILRLDELSNRKT